MNEILKWTLMMLCLDTYLIFDWGLMKAGSFQLYYVTHVRQVSHGNLFICSSLYTTLVFAWKEVFSLGLWWKDPPKSWWPKAMEAEQPVHLSTSPPFSWHSKALLGHYNVSSALNSSRGRGTKGKDSFFSRRRNIVHQIHFASASELPDLAFLKVSKRII